jgi:arylsulfatase A-like enzyme
MRRLLMGTLGGLLGGAVVGLAEATWIITNAAGDIDRMALPYSAVLYGLIGLGLGGGTTVGSLILGKFWKGMTDGHVWTLGKLGAFVPLGMVIARYYANKVIYAEGGVPMSGNLAILGIFGAVALVELFISPRLANGPLKWAANPGGTLGLWMGATGLAAGIAMGTAPAEPAMNPGRDVPDAAKGRANVLLVVVDTLRADYLSPYDARWDGKTPVIQALADDGVVFERAHANSSWTRPGFANMYSSRVPSSHKSGTKSAMLPDAVETLAETLSAGGYTTGGLPNNTNVTSSFNFHQGFDYYPYMAPEMAFGATESTYQLAMYSVLRKVGERLKGNNHKVTDFYQPATTVLGRGQAFIEAQGENPWFLMAHLMEPHDPYFERPFNGTAYGRAEHEVPEAEKVEYLKDLYAAEIQAMDGDIAPLIQWLKDSGRYDNTVIILTADHGEEFMEHGGWWHGTTLYQEQIHIPLIVKLASSTNAGTRVPWTVSQIDIAPTVAAIAGAAAPDVWQGADVLGPEFATFVAPPPAAPPVDDDATPATPEEEAAAAVEAAAAKPDPRDNDRVILAEEDFEGNRITAVRKGDMKLIQANADNPRGLGEDELYNLAADPGEQTLLGAEAADDKAGLETVRAAELAKATGEAVEAEARTDMTLAECERLQMLGYIDNCDEYQ